MSKYQYPYPYQSGSQYKAQYAPTPYFAKVHSGFHPGQAIQQAPVSLVPLHLSPQHTQPLQHPHSSHYVPIPNVPPPLGTEIGRLVPHSTYRHMPDTVSHPVPSHSSTQVGYPVPHSTHLHMPDTVSGTQPIPSSTQVCNAVQHSAHSPHALDSHNQYTNGQAHMNTHSTQSPAVCRVRSGSIVVKTTNRGTEVEYVEKIVYTNGGCCKDFTCYSTPGSTTVDTMSAHPLEVQLAGNPMPHHCPDGLDS